MADLILEEIAVALHTHDVAVTKIPPGLRDQYLREAEWFRRFLAARGVAIVAAQDAIQQGK